MSDKVKILLVMYFLSAHIVASQENENAPIGPNVCMHQETHWKLVNVSYYETIKEMETELCFALVPVCNVMKTKVITKYKTQNQTREVNIRKCCNGYLLDPLTKRCNAICKNPCIFGNCSQPDTCKCMIGYSGSTCEDVGCPSPFLWGENCSKKCDCSMNGMCNVHTGQCACYPGYRGSKCIEKCPKKMFGHGCKNECTCLAGSTCNFVTGDCTQCPMGTYGEECVFDCDCHNEGTLLCHHVRGHCFCKPSYYGSKCEKKCPFGFMDGVCYTKPIPDKICSCPNQFYECDPSVGCVCKLENQCGELLDIPSTIIQPLGVSSVSHQTSSGVIGGSIGVTLILMILFVIILLYRRRLNRSKEDLKNRGAVFYSVSDGNGRLNNEMVILNHTQPNQIEPKNTVQNNFLHQGGTSLKNSNIDEKGTCALMPNNANIFNELQTDSKDNGQLAEMYKKSGKSHNVDVVLNDPVHQQKFSDRESDSDDDLKKECHSKS